MQSWIFETLLERVLETETLKFSRMSKPQQAVQFTCWMPGFKCLEYEKKNITHNDD